MQPRQRGLAFHGPTAPGGFNRISLGAQSADERQAAVHPPDPLPRQVVQAVTDIRKAKIENLSLDLILGLPGQTMASWEDTLRKALSLNPDHISCYGLKVEENTPWPSMWPTGWSSRTTMPRLTSTSGVWNCSARAASGSTRSPTSPNQEGVPPQPEVLDRRGYVGFGPGAHSDFGGRRYAYPRDLEGYIRAVAAGSVPFEDCQTITATEQAREYLLLQMRTLYGIEEWEYRRLFWFKL